MRSITRQLYPSIIRTELPSALNSLADRFRAMFFVELEIDGGMSEPESPVAPKLNDSVRLTIYRVTEEALGNVAKHSEATTAYISLSFASRREVVLEIRDDGVGFDETKINLGQGLLSLEDYVTALGGTIEVSSSPGEGTSIRASVPFPSTKQQAIEQSHERMYSMV